MNSFFKENWLKILNFNRNSEIYDKITQLKELVRIPLTPIKIKGHILYYAFEVLYSKFINDQQNILDIIISQENKQILGLYLYKTKKVGIHEEYQKLPLDIIPYQENDFDNLDELINKIQTIIMEKNDVKISSLRIFKESALDLIDEYCNTLENISFYDFLYQFLELIQNLLNKELLLLYPKPNAYKFLKETIDLLNGIKISKIFELICEILPDFDVSFIINLKEFLFIFKLQNQVFYSEKSKLSFKTIASEELGIDNKKMTPNEILSVVRDKLTSETAYFMNFNQIISFLIDLFELERPVNKDKLLLLFQKCLYGFRSYENLWAMTPKPKVYNGLLRFFMRSIGINLNFKKISHWAIPEIILNFYELNYGFNNKILIILTDLNKQSTLDHKNNDFISFSFKTAFLIESEKGSPAKFSLIEKNEIINDNEKNSLDLIRNRISAKYGYISAVLNLDLLFLRRFIDVFILKFYKFHPLARIKIVRMLKKKYFFNIYPEIPLLKSIRKKGIFSLFKILLPVLIDNHEF